MIVYKLIVFDVAFLFSVSMKLRYVSLIEYMIGIDLTFQTVPDPVPDLLSRAACYLLLVLMNFLIGQLDYYDPNQI